jgi:hypothetical protein
VNPTGSSVGLYKQECGKSQEARADFARFPECGILVAQQQLPV